MDVKGFPFVVIHVNFDEPAEPSVYGPFVTRQDAVDHVKVLIKEQCDDAEMTEDEMGWKWEANLRVSNSQETYVIEQMLR